MRIALVTTEFVTENLFDGGLANYLLRLALSLKNMGHNPVIFVTTNKTEVIFYRDIEVHRVAANFEDIPKFSKLRIIHKLYRTFRYINNSYKINSYLKTIHKKEPFDIAQYTHLMGLGMFRCEEIPSIIRLSAYTKAWIEANELKGFIQQYFWERLAMYRTDGIFGPSQLVNSIVKQNLKINSRLIESPFSLDIVAENPQTYLKFLEGKKYLLFFGTIGLLKGIGSIIKILKRIFQKYPNIFFVFAGKDQGTPDGKPLIPQLYDAAGEFREHVIYLGRLRHEELYPIIENAYAVILPSRIDNFPNTCIEAMAHQRIVIGTKGTSFEQLINDGINGFLCEKDNEISLLETIDKVMELDKVKKDHIGLKALERIQELRPEFVVTQLLDYYSEVIDKKNKKNYYGR